ncbi:MAG TPA: hypothetical protein VFV23_11290 [Verrucomicrobiae bacterium]|nr:hypothetical protein [Verrucomicrobiae bacterium]
MKIFPFFAALVSLLAFTAAAQVSITISLDQDQFLPSETIPVTVRVTNRSGQMIHLGDQPDWLTFSVESADGFIVSKNAEVPVLGAFNLGSMETATKRVDIQPYFGLSRPGLYRVTATLRIPGWNSEITSTQRPFDISSGAKIWSQVFGMPAASNAPPEVRKYILEKSNYLRSQLRLYAVVTDEAEGRIIKVTPVGPTVSFSQPQAQLDRLNNLHILYQSGAKSFLYSIVNPNGMLVDQEIYDYADSRPRLTLDDSGNIIVIGGVKRVLPQPVVVPDIKSPDELVPPKK